MRSDFFMILLQGDMSWGYLQALALDQEKGNEEFVLIPSSLKSTCSCSYHPDSGYSLLFLVVHSTHRLRAARGDTLGDCCVQPEFCFCPLNWTRSHSPSVSIILSCLQWIWVKYSWKRLLWVGFELHYFFPKCKHKSSVSDSMGWRGSFLTRESPGGEPVQWWEMELLTLGD